MLQSNVTLLNSSLLKIRLTTEITLTFFPVHLEQQTEHHECVLSYQYSTIKYGCYFYLPLKFSKPNVSESLYVLLCVLYLL